MRILLTLSIWLFVCISTVLSQNDCKQFVADLLNQKYDYNPSVQTSEQKAYFKYSGIKGRFDLGHKAKCEENPLMKYYILAKKTHRKSSKVGAFRQEETSVCLPGICSKKILRKDHLLLEKLLEINSWPLKNHEKVVLYDLNEAPPRGLGYYCLVALFATLVSLCVISTAEALVRRKRKGSNSASPATANSIQRFWLFKAFDLIENAKSLYLTAAELGQSEQISTFGFLRFLGALWIIVFHVMNLNTEHFKHQKSSSNPEIDYIISNGRLAVGYFFFIGGFLAAYNIASKASRTDGSGIRKYICGYISEIYHRLIRVWPGVAISVLFFWFGLVGLLNGPLWGRFIGMAKVCDERWWQKLLLIDNFFEQPGGRCTGWTWYLDVDFQTYSAVVFIAYLYVKNKPLGYMTAFGVIYYSIAHGITLFKAVRQEKIDLHNHWYVVPSARCFEIIIGVVFGLHYYEYAKLRWRRNFFALCENYALLKYLFIIGGLYLNYLGIYGESQSEAFWQTMKRVILSVGVALVFMPLANNKPSLIKTIMNLRIFQILGKLSFGAYLFHFPIILALMYTEETYPNSYELSKVLDTAWKTLLIVFGVALIYYLIMEKPILNIEAHFTKRSRSTPSVKSSSTANVENQSSQQPNQDSKANFYAELNKTEKSPNKTQSMKEEDPENDSIIVVERDRRSLIDSHLELSPIKKNKKQLKQ